MTKRFPAYAEPLVAMMRQHLAMRSTGRSAEVASRLRYNGWEDFVLTHGRLFVHDPTNRPERHFVATTPRECFTNALTAAALDDDLTYVEGFAFNGILPVHHAWVVDEDGRVYDPTWENLEGRACDEPDVYLGVPFETDYAVETVTAKGTDTLMDWTGGGVTLEDEPGPGEIRSLSVGIPVPKRLRGPDPEIVATFTRLAEAAA